MIEKLYLSQKEVRIQNIKKEIKTNVKYCHLPHSSLQHFLGNPQRIQTCNIFLQIPSTALDNLKRQS